jgi:hypothetical protein
VIAVDPAGSPNSKEMRIHFKKTIHATIISIVAGLIAGVILIRFEPHLNRYFFPPSRRFTYSLSVQKMQDGKPYQDPFKSSGQEIFENGYKFKFNLMVPEAGYFYLFNEGRADDGKSYFNILYPTPKRNGGSASVAANQLIETAENAFGGQPDTENLWIIWTKELTPQLEAAKSAAFSGTGKIREMADAERFRKFLQDYSTNAPDVLRDADGRQSTILAKGDVVVSLLYLEHR